MMERDLHSDRTEGEQDWQESVSTEDVTGSEEQHDGDNQSVVSDLFSLSQRSTTKKHENRKLLSTIQRLKQENMLLRDTLESSNLQEVGLLKSKLRGANADIVRLRQRNTELKERVQALELKIFEMASSSGPIRSSNNTNSAQPQPSLLSIKDKLKFMKRNQLQAQSQDSVSATSVRPADVTEAEEGSRPPQSSALSSGSVSYGEYLALYNRSRHFEKLVRSYERKIEAMQVQMTTDTTEATSSSTTQPTASSSSSSSSGIQSSIAAQGSRRTVEFAEAKTDSNAVESPPNRTQYEEATAALAAAKKRQQRDTNTIRELAEEVKRLTGLLSRREIVESESVQSVAEDGLHSEENHNIASATTKNSTSKGNRDTSDHGNPRSGGVATVLSFVFVFLLGVLTVLVAMVSLQGYSHTLFQ